MSYALFACGHNFVPYGFIWVFIFHLLFYKTYIFHLLLIFPVSVFLVFRFMFLEFIVILKDIIIYNISEYNQSRAL